MEDQKQKQLIEDAKQQQAALRKLTTVPFPEKQPPWYIRMVADIYRIKLK